jgi:hypothetical protein
MRWQSSFSLVAASSLVFASIAIAQSSSWPGRGSDTPGARFDVQYSAQPEFAANTSASALGSVTQGNTTIIFQPADTSDIDLQRMQTWGEFANSHPRIASALAYKPSLISDDGYLNKHPELREFFQAHPDVRDAMVENPGNFVAIPPRPGE